LPKRLITLKMLGVDQSQTQHFAPLFKFTENLGL